MRPRKIWYSVSVFSVCTVQDLGIWSENIQGGLQSLSPKDKFILPSETGRMELEIRGNGKDTRPVELHTVWEKITLMLWPSTELQRVDPSDTKKKKKRQHLRNYQASLLRREALWSVRHMEKRKSLRNDPRTSSLLYTHVFRKPNLPFITFTKQHSVHFVLN